jgi:hypothetical protein
VIAPKVRRNGRGVREIRWYGVCRKCRAWYRVPFVHPMAAQQMAELCPCDEPAGTLTELALSLLDRSA